jgi:hypothetical protein
MSISPTGQPTPSAGLLGPTGPTGATGATGVMGTTLALAEGFTLDVLPATALRGSLAAAANVQQSIALTAGFWYSVTAEVVIKNSTGPAYYVCRQQIEAYRDAGAAVIHYQPTQRPIESPVGGSFSVAVTAVGNNLVVQANNGSANTVQYAVYTGATRKPMPA